MANEAVIIELFNGGRPMRYTVADGTGIEKGTIMELSGDKTIQANQTDNTPCVGIAAHEKVASDGSTTLAVYTDGIFDCLTDAGSDALGVAMSSSATANTLQTADAADLLNWAVLGNILEAAGNAEVVAVRVNK